MALSLSELIAAAKQKDDQIGVMDRYQNTVNNVSGAIGDIIGALKGGKMIGGLNGIQNGQNIGGLNGLQGGV